MGGRVVLHSDLNNCYASIECMLHPELRGKFIAVCGSTEDRHGIVLAKNQLAKQCGVKTGEVIWEALLYPTRKNLSFLSNLSTYLDSMFTNLTYTSRMGG